MKTMWCNITTGFTAINFVGRKDCVHEAEEDIGY